MDQELQDFTEMKMVTVIISGNMALVHVVLVQRYIMIEASNMVVESQIVK